jgi:chemotaxis protein MotB
MNKAPVVMLVVLMIMAVVFALYSQEQARQKAALLQTANRKAEAMQQRLQSSDTAAAALEQRLADLERRLTQNGETTQRLEAALAENGRLTTRNQELGAAVDRLNEQLETARQALSVAKQDIQRRQDAIDGLQTQLDENRHRQDATETEKQQLAAAYRDLKQRIDTRDAEVASAGRDLSITVLDRILFDSGKTTISEAGRRILDHVAGVLKNLDGKTVRVVGHTDAVPIAGWARHIYPSNWELSGMRAAAVVRYFQDVAGIDPARMALVGRAYYHPRDKAGTEAARARNRRVEIIIAPQLKPAD